jgi:hypothetical protein
VRVESEKKNVTRDAGVPEPFNKRQQVVQSEKLVDALTFFFELTSRLMAVASVLLRHLRLEVLL